MRQRVISAWGIQTVPFASHYTPFVLENFQLFHFHTGSQFLLPQRANYGSWENFPFPNMDKTEGIECLGHSNWTICSPLSPLCSEIFTTFPLSYWRAHFHYPRGLMMGKGNSPNSKTDETGRSKYLFHFHLKEPFYTTDKGVFCTERGRS